MKKGKAIIFSAFTCLALFSCVACSTNAKGNSSTGSGNTNTPSDTEKPSNSTVPEYKGMTISQNSSRRVVNEKNVFKANNATDNEAIDGEERATSEVPEYDDHKEKEDTIEENIEDLVSIDVETDDEVKYYVQPKETFTVEIHLSNPNQYEIQSFTLNGKKYSNYMFKDGSTMELLLLETTAPSTPGYYEYTIDAIKYIDGTEIKDVKMSGDKTIKTGIEYSSAPTASISSLNISTTYVGMGIDVTDTYSLIGKNEVFVYLSDGENIIDKKSLKVGSNEITFENLEAHTLYEYGVITAFDLVDGQDLHSEWLLTDTFTTESIYSLSNIETTKTTISFEVNKNGEAGQIDSISLYDNSNGRLVASGDSSTRSFDGLLSNHTYKLYVDFSYMINDTKIADWVGEDITTIAKVEPKIEILDISSDKTSVRYKIDMEDSDGVGAIDKVELIKDGVIVSTNNGMLEGEFNNLLSGNRYKIKVNYSYDLNDGNGVINSFIEEDIDTIAKNKPSIKIDSKLVTDSSISADIVLDDVDSVGVINSVTLYKGNEVVAINSSKEVNFNDLDYYTDYKVVISYSYDLNDGKGMIEEVYEKEFKTSPYIDFKSCNIINTSAVSEGETIYMQVSLDNPSGAIPESVVVNGQKYNCASSTSQNKIYVEIINNGQFEGGNTEIIIQKVNMKLDGKIYSVEPKNNNSDSVFINGILSVESLELVNSNNEIVYYAFPKDEMKLLLTLKNKTGYSIDGTSLGEWIKIDDNHYYKNVTLKNGWNYYDLTSISYSNDSLSKTLNIGYCSSNRVYKVNSNSIVEINSLSGLQNTTFNGGYYKLTSDIDLSKTEWTNLGSFNGILDGNGYSIKNMTNVSTVTDKDINIGLFKDASGLFLNCKLEDVTIMMTLNSTTPDEYFASFGGFVSGTCFSDNIDASFINCEVTGDISINNTTSDETYVGGLVGYEYPYPPYLYIDNCRTNININIKKGNNTSGVGAGLVGYFAWANCKIFVYNSYVEGSINASSAQVINGTTPWSPDIVDYKNNRCNVLLNGVKTTSISDLYIYGD